MAHHPKFVELDQINQTEEKMGQLHNTNATNSTNNTNNNIQHLIQPGTIKHIPPPRPQHGRIHYPIPHIPMMKKVWVSLTPTMRKAEMTAKEGFLERLKDNLIDFVAPNVGQGTLYTHQS